MAKRRTKLPKTLLGVRIPKPIRLIGEDVLANPLGRELIAEALVNAAAGLLRSQVQPQSATRRALEHPVESAADAGESVSGAASNTAATVARAVDGLLGYFQGDNQRPRKRKAKGLKRRGKKRKNGPEARAHH
jgi:hypothetical protein